MDIPSNFCHPATREEWRAWLAENHARKEGVWLIRYKKATGKPYVGYHASVEEEIADLRSLPTQTKRAALPMYRLMQGE